MTTVQNIALAGGGLAAVAAIETLRAGGYDGRILLLSDEPQLPYDRPPLSKAYLSGAADEASIQLHDEAWYAEHRVDLELGAAVTALDVGAKKVQTTKASWDYDRLILAFGARARLFPVELSPAGTARLHYLRSLGDVDRLRAAAQPGAKVVMIGGGVIGMEAAATLSQVGCSVTVLEGADRIMARFFPPLLSELLTQVHRDKGIEVLTGIKIETLGEAADQLVITLSDGRVIAADQVLVGIGVVPNTEIAAAAGLTLRLQGIEVDAYGHSSAPRVYAVGDLSTFPLADGTFTRWENWTHARNQAAVAAKHILGQTTPYGEIPWIWSDQYDFNLQVTGSSLADQVVLRGSLDAGRLTAFHLQNGRIAGATTINDARNKSSIRKLIERSAVVDPAILSDTGTDLKKLAAA